MKKIAKVDLCFSFNKYTRWYFLHFLSWLWPIFSTEKNGWRWCRKFAQNYSKCTKKAKTVSFGPDLLQDENIDHAEKKSSKKRCWTRPSSCWNLGLKNANIVLQISVHNLLASNISIIQMCSTRPFFPYWVDWEVFILSTTNIKWDGNLSEIFGCR